MIETVRKLLKNLIEIGATFKQSTTWNEAFTNPLIKPTIGSFGSQYEQWLQDVKTFNERYLKKHPAYNNINTTLHLRPNDTLSKLIGYLQSVYGDDYFWNELNNNPSKVSVPKYQAKILPEYDIFLSHANSDKISYVEDLYNSLSKLGVKIFYDKDAIKWGDNWKEKIINGVQNSEFAILVISNNYFGREWTEKELYELLNRQNRVGQKIILPILYNISIEELSERYPMVADIQALNYSEYSCDEIALKFAEQFIIRLKG